MKPIKAFTLFGLLLLTTIGLADQITFSFVSFSGNMRDVTANAAGLTAGPALNLLATDATTGISTSLPGVVNMSTGAASTFTVMPAFVIATYDGGGANSVSILNPITMAPLLTGITTDNAALFATYPGGTGAFSSGFLVTFLDQSILALFGLGHVDPRGSLSVTLGQDTFSPSTLTAVAGGGTITVVGTPVTAVKEPLTILLLGSGMVGSFGYARKRRMI